MTAAQMNLQRDVETDGTEGNDRDGRAFVPPFRLGPAVWNLFYYGILAGSFLLALLALLSGRSLTSAVLVFFVTLLGSTVLGVAFFSFVAIPLQIKHYERVQEARREAVRAAHEAAARRAEEAALAYKREREARLARLQAADAILDLGFAGIDEERDEDQAADANSAPDPSNADAPEQATAPDDQASSLRRLMAEIAE